jgi:Domain of unknown function (DUF5658)
MTPVLALPARIGATDGMRLFVYLQLLDFLTTMLAFRLGAVELSPLVRLFLNCGPTAGVILAKLLAIVVIGLFYSRKSHIMRWVNYWFAGIVVWNLGMMLWRGHTAIS